MSYFTFCFGTKSSKSRVYPLLRAYSPFRLVTSQGLDSPMWLVATAFRQHGSRRCRLVQKLLVSKTEKARWALAIQKVTENQVRTTTLSSRQLDLRFCFPISRLSLMCVSKCCFTIPRSDIDLTRFTVTWNKAIRKKLKAGRGLGTQSRLPWAHLSVAPLPRLRPSAAQHASLRGGGPQAL